MYERKINMGLVGEWDEVGMSLAHVHWYTLVLEFLNFWVLQPDG